MNIQEIQKRAYQNKVRHNFNVTDVPLEFCYLNREVGEAFEAYMNKNGKVGEELADIGIYLLGLCEILGVDLEKEMLSKIDINESRVYINNSKYRLILDSVKLENQYNLILVDNYYNALEKLVKECLGNNINCDEYSIGYSENHKHDGILTLNLDMYNFFETLNHTIRNVVKTFDNNIITMMSRNKDLIQKLYNELNIYDLGVYKYDLKECIRVK